MPQQDDRAENNAAINELDSAMESFDDQLGDEEDDFILDEIPGDEIPHVESESDDNNTPEAVQQAKEPASSQEQEQTPADADETPLSDIGEPDLAGNAGEDLIDLLNNGGLADLGDMLSEDGKVSEDEGDSEFENSLKMKWKQKIRIVEILIIRMNSRLKKRKRDSLPEYLRLFSKKEAEQKNLKKIMQMMQKIRPRFYQKKTSRY